MTGERGFTLLEMSIVLLLVALISTAMVEGLRFGLRTYARVVEVDDASREMFVAQQFLRSALEVAYPFDPQRAGGRAYGLEGTSAQLSFTASAARSIAPGALRRYEVFVAADDRMRQQHLVLRWQPDRNGSPVPRTALAQEEVLVGNIARVEWSYATVRCDTADTQWQDSWQGRQALPRLIRLRVIFSKDDPRRWPELLIAPRVTDNATSWLDQPSSGGAGCGVLE